MDGDGDANSDTEVGELELVSIFGFEGKTK